MFNIMFWHTVSLAALDWTATEKGWRSIRWISKPGTLITLIVWFSQSAGWQGIPFWFVLGLLFSLLGDILLHMPKRYFLPGIGAFFLAQCSYIAGFNILPLSPHWTFLIPALALSAIYVGMIRMITAALRERQENSLILPVRVYAAVLCLMGLSGISTLYRPDWQLVPAALASLGACLFLASDLMLALQRFVKPLPHGDLRVMVTYHLGQVLIASGVLLQFRG